MEIIDQDKDFTGRKLTPKMKQALEHVVKTSGGGVSFYDYPRAIWVALIRRGLVQGKKGNQARVVHTREGLEYIRQKEITPSPQA